MRGRATLRKARRWMRKKLKRGVRKVKPVANRSFCRGEGCRLRQRTPRQIFQWSPTGASAIASARHFELDRGQHARYFIRIGDIGFYDQDLCAEPAQLSNRVPRIR